MIIIDNQNELANYLEKINFDLFGVVKLDQVTFELSNSLIDEVTIIHQDILKNLDTKSLAKLQGLSVIMIFGNDESVITDNTIDLINENTPKNLFENKIMLLSDLIKERQVLKSQLISINKELNETMGNVEVELLKIKKLYERKAPRRFNNIKGIQVHSKYTAGENIGGEFFDIFLDGNFAFVVMSSTSSYLASSMVLKLFADLKQEGIINKEVMENFIDDMKSNIVELNSSKKKEIETHLFTGLIDLKKHTMEGHIYGDFNILSSQVETKTSASHSLIEVSLEESAFFKEFQREERILLCSPGFIKNWRKLKPDFLIEELMVNKKVRPIDLLDETFFQLKKDSQSPFLSYDASAIFMEVRKNAMVEV